MKRNKKIISTKTKPPQKGAVTHHQLQVIFPRSFNTTKQTPSKPKIPIPCEDELDELFIFNDLLI